jgi:hypothetical protein
VFIIVSGKKFNAAICTILIFFVLDAVILLSATTSLSENSEKALDKFGIKEIYPTKLGGREWFLNS